MEKVKVRIYGQDYTIAGEKDVKTIRDIGQYVNDKMLEIGRHFTSNAQGTLPVLTAINITEELFDAWTEADKLEREKNAAVEEATRISRMWEEAKQNFAQYKEGATQVSMEKDSMTDRIKELEDKIQEMESAYFELQMENVQLQNKLNR